MKIEAGSPQERSDSGVALRIFQFTERMDYIEYTLNSSRIVALLSEYQNIRKRTETPERHPAIFSK